MTSKRDDTQGVGPEGLANKAKNALPGDEDVEGHRAGKSVVDDGGPEGLANKAKNAFPGAEDDDVEGHRAGKSVVDDGGPEGLANKAKNAFPGAEDDDVEGHIFHKRESGGELMDRKVPGDSPHGEGVANKNKL